jgi:hypothetical protein
MADLVERVSRLEQQLQANEAALNFVMRILSLTCRTPNGKTDSRSLTTLYKESLTHAGPDPQTFAEVAQRAFARGDRSPSAPGPDGFPGAAGDEPPPAAR